MSHLEVREPLHLLLVLLVPLVLLEDVLDLLLRRLGLHRGLDLGGEVDAGDLFWKLKNLVKSRREILRRE